MPELRNDPITRRWVIIAPERTLRPTDFKKPESVMPPPEKCPFCEQNENLTPPEIFAFRKPGTQKNKPGWSVRVIPNKFPALRIEGDLGRRGAGLYDSMNGVGAHEVIIETPEHNKQISDFSEDELKKVFQAYIIRMNDLKNDRRFRYLMAFKNHKFSAGATLMHSHSQLIALPVTPKRVAEELDNTRVYFKNKERCMFCDIINQELLTKERVVWETKNFIVLTPYASRFPFEIHVMPKYHCSDFPRTDDAQITELSGILRKVFSALKNFLNDPPFNFIIHTAPLTTPRPGRPDYWKTLEYDYHWHIEIIPRLTNIAGFEWGTGFYINSVSPEEAKKSLNEAIKEEE